jgi:hypothetical protein
VVHGAIGVCVFVCVVRGAIVVCVVRDTCSE